MTDFIGGDFWWDPRYETDRLSIPTEGMSFLNGGEAALRVICDDLIARGLREMLIPAYVCPSVVDALERYGLAYGFYAIKDDFRIDLEQLQDLAARYKVLYQINYFGYGFSDAELSVIRQLKAQGVYIIEDDAQAGFNRASPAHARFNSLRKLVPHDGSFFYSDRDVSAQLAKYAGLPNQRLPVIRAYRQTFARLLAEGAESFDSLNPLFEQAERHYYADLTVLGDPDERATAERLDWAAIEAARKANHRRLCERLAGMPEIELIFPEVSPDSPPYGFPIYVKAGRRDALLDYLRERYVYPVVHWPLNHDPRINTNPKAVEMSGKIITLFLDQRFSLEDMDYQAATVRAFFGR